MGTVLELQDFNVTYVNRHKDQRVYAVKNASFSIEKGDSMGLVGESGSGKSTMAMALLRLLSPRSTEIGGKAIFMDQDLTQLSEEKLRQIRWKHLSVVFQKSMNALSPVHRIGDQLEDIYRVHEPNVTKKAVFERASMLFQLVNLSDRVYHLYPHELSGGMLQRVCIALSLLHNPNLLILDEATTALDVVTQGQILDEIEKLEKTLDMTRIMITHDMSVVAASCNKVAVMYAGEMMEIGYTKDILKNPNHPYTQGLLASFPSLTEGKEKLKAIPGFLPDLSKKVEGCIFAPRCDKRQRICDQVRPEMQKLSDGRQIRCHLYGKEGQNE